MKKAKRLLAILLAVVMIAGSAFLPAYARKGGKGGESDYTDYDINNVRKYYFSAEQGCTYILDMLDQMLAEANLNMPWNSLIKDIEVIGIDVSSAICDLVEDMTDISALDFSSIDQAVYTIDKLLDALNDGLLEWLQDPKILGISIKGLLDFGDINLLSETAPYITRSIKRGTNPNYQDGNYDIEVLDNVIYWLSSLDKLVAAVASGNFSLGLLNDALPDDIGDILFHLPTWLSNLLYTTLVDSSATTIPQDMTVDKELQMVIDWALVSGTGESADTGANSILGPDFEAFLPAIADEPGGASIGNEKIMADRDGDGVPEEHTMSFYQLVSNAIQALLNGMLSDLLYDVLIDAYEDDTTIFNTIVEAVEGLCVMNGAPSVEYTEEAETDPVAKINCLLNWLFMPNGGLATLIKFDYEGIHIQDNFMSLLNDLARMAPNLVGGLLEMELPDTLVYSDDELKRVMYYTQDSTTSRSVHTLADLGISYDDSKSIADLQKNKVYLSYEKDENGNQYVLYGTEFREKSKNVYEATNYALLSNGKSISEYGINPTFVRECYEVPTSKVWASLIKVVLNSLIEGCYFPEWADSIASAGAYALASMAATILPEENFIERLDRYHYENELGETYTFVNKDKAYDALPYTESVTDPTGRHGAVVVPRAAMDIAASIGAFYLNGEFDFIGKKLTTHNTSFEQFLFEMLMFAFTKYLPVIAGDYTSGTFHNGAFSTSINACLDAVYSDKVNRTYKDNPNFGSVYMLLNDTLFSLLPSDWLPAKFAGSFAFLNDWLLNSVLNIDLQKLFSLFSVNNEGELNNSVTQVLLNIVARVLALVFGKTAILPATSNEVVFTTSPTTVNSFASLLSGTNLATFLTNLLHALYNKRTALENTIFPLILSQNFTPKYDSNILGTNLTSKKIADLSNYIDELDKDINGIPQSGVVNFTKLSDAKAAAALLNKDYETKMGETGAYYSVEFLASYEDESIAKQAANFFEDGYVTSYNGLYYVYAARDYMDSAGSKQTVNESNGDISYKFSDFNYSTLTGPRSSASPTVKYDSAYRSFAPEDFKGGVHFYNNYETALDNAKDFVDDYNSLATSDLPKAYQAWAKFSINARLYAAGLYDANGDGAVNDSDSKPSIPSEMYPYYTGDSVQWKFYDAVNQGIIGRNTTVDMNEFNATNYEVFDIAQKFGNEEKNDVELTVPETEAVVRLALKTIAFDITADASGNYAGNLNWSNISDAQRTSINDTCNAIGFKFDSANNKISMKAFAPITENNIFFDSLGVATRPALFTGDEDYVQEIKSAICSSYDSYVDEMYNTRIALYNNIDEVGRRTEEAESARSSTADITSLLWLLKYTSSAYINPISRRRNLVIAGADNGVTIYNKIYTSASFEKFRLAYDFAQSVADAATSITSTAGFTQSIISSAYIGLIKAFQGLVLFYGAADWKLLDSTIAAAEAIVANGNTDGDLGIKQESYNALVAELNVAKALRLLDLDCESDDRIAEEAHDLNNIILNLEYNCRPQIIPAESSDVVVEEISDSGLYKQGRIFNLGEGRAITDDGVTSDLITVVGTFIDPSLARGLEFNPADKGYGTGATVKVKINGDYVCSYTAVIFGDLNGDTRIDGTDKSLIEYFFLTGDSSVMGTTKKLAADVNHDGIVNLDDAKQIRDYYNYIASAEINQNPQD